MATRRSPRHSLTDAQWDLISDLFQVEYCGTGRRPRDRRVIINAIFWVLRTGAPWRDLPAEFGPWSTPWDFFDKWNKDGTFDRVLRRLRSNAIPDRTGRDDLWCIDGTSIRAARCSSGGGKTQNSLEPVDHALGRSRGGFGSKIHILCDSKGLPLHFALSAGQIHDSKVFQEVLDGADYELYSDSGQVLPWPFALAGDKGYRADYIDDLIVEAGMKPVIPSKRGENRDSRPVVFDKTAYKRRSIVECLIGWLKESRRICTRFEKTAINFGGMVKLAFIHRFLRLSES